MKFKIAYLLLFLSSFAAYADCKDLQGSYSIHWPKGHRRLIEIWMKDCAHAIVKDTIIRPDGRTIQQTSTRTMTNGARIARTVGKETGTDSFEVSSPKLVRRSQFENERSVETLELDSSGNLLVSLEMWTIGDGAEEKANRITDFLCPGSNSKCFGGLRVQGPSEW